MADKTVKITFEIDGLTQSVTNIDDAKVALQQLETQAKKAGDAADGAAKDFDKMGDASKDAGEAGEGAISVLDEATGGLASRFKNVIGGIGKMGTALKASFKAGVQGASSLKKALIATGIGALVVAVGLLVAYWDDIVGFINGASAAQQKLLKDAEDNVAVQQEALDAISAQENSLRLAGKSEEEIRQLKIAQTAEVIKATELQLIQQKALKKSQVEAAERNQKIAAGVIAFLAAPITILLGAIDALTYGLAKVGVLSEGTNLAEGFLKGGASLLGFDPESIEAEGDAAIEATEKQLVKLQNQKDGFILQGQKADADAAAKRDADAQAAYDKQKALDEKAAADKKAAEEKAAADAQKLWDQYVANRQTINDLLQQADLDSIENTFERAMAELAIQRDADLEKIRAAGATESEIDRIKDSYTEKAKKLAKDEADFKKQLAQQNVDDALNATKAVLGNIISASAEGSAIAKAAAQAQNAIDTYQSATAAYKATVGIPIVGPVLAPIAAAAAVAAGLANARKIAAIKAPGDKGGGGAPNISVPTGPTFDPTQATRTVEAGNNVVTATGNGQANGQQVIKAYVISSDVTSQQEADAKIKDLSRL
tara:strand:+ start:618 stop:2417 length:1800 start_codon:yes stop_codon:yes gene_type:complete